MQGRRIHASTERRAPRVWKVPGDGLRIPAGTGLAEGRTTYGTYQAAGTQAPAEGEAVRTTGGAVKALHVRIAPDGPHWVNASIYGGLARGTTLCGLYAVDLPAKALEGRQRCSRCWRLFQAQPRRRKTGTLTDRGKAASERAHEARMVLEGYRVAHGMASVEPQRRIVRDAYAEKLAAELQWALDQLDKQEGRAD